MSEDSPEYLAAMCVLTEKDIKHALEMLENTDKARLYSRGAWGEDVPDVPNPYDGGYLPLNLWDQTKDE